jgi:hypothetical protein
MGVMSKEKTRSSGRKKRAKISGVMVGLLAGRDQEGVLLVDYPGNKNGYLPARATVSLSEKQVGQEVALMFEEGDPERPLIVGMLQNPKAPAPRPRPVHATVDGETITFTAEKEIVLRCGKATIVLTQDGKVVIRGKYLLSRSSGVNRIQGGSIELN